MKVSDYIVEYLINKGIKDVFGYPGGMVTHLIDSLERRHDAIKQHLTFNEQGAAMAACGYAQAGDNIGVAYATSGPGATNLITGICNAYFDSVPVVFLTGQVNTTESKKGYNIRQRGFQETDIVEVVSSITKYAEYVSTPEKIKYCLDKAFAVASSGRKGPVLIDIPMNVLRAEIDDVNSLEGSSDHYIEKKITKSQEIAIRKLIDSSCRPVIIVGNGIKTGDCTSRFRQMMEDNPIPVVTSMLAVDVPDNSYGFIGAYGHRTANFIVAKADLVISIGARLDIRQVGLRRELFAPNAKVLRFDIDSGELEYQVHNDEIDVNVSAETAIELLTKLFHNSNNYSKWISTCDTIRSKLNNADKNYPTEVIAKISRAFSKEAIITSDVGQNQVWVSQSIDFHGKKLLTSGGHGAMGYSVPAAIGAAIASGQTVYCFVGDGGIQMNIQELQFLSREKLPVKIILLNNSSLGLIRQFQEKYFHSYYSMTTTESGFENPDYSLIASAYGIRYQFVKENNDAEIEYCLADKCPCIIEVFLPELTYVIPKLEFGKPNQDQDPLLDRELYEELMQLGC